jgi:prolyl-tRNA synthetase
MPKLTSPEQDYAKWYNELVQQAQLAENSPVRGSMVIRPYGYALWENMQAALDGMFKATGHENVYFPMLIPESFIRKEAEHIEGFAPELAVVTHAGGKQLEESLVLRPTSETIIWDAYRNWIQSYRDLPLLYNQWANVVRWEMRPRLFLRTTEFLWQEGHTAHATQQEAVEETLQMLDVYARFAEEWMAVPVVRGVKTANERFAGAVDTYCVEAMMRDTKALQAGTSHFLGQNFAKAFDVTFQNESGELDHPWATSWGVSTRLIGAIIMAHGDANGLRLPPKLAPHQVGIIPIFKSDEQRAQVLGVAEKIAAELRDAGVRVKLDDRDNVRPGFKFNEAELRGIPVRIEIGPRDIEEGNVVIFRRDIGEKATIPQTGVTEKVTALLDGVQQTLFNEAQQFRQDNTHVVDTWDDFKERTSAEGGCGFMLAHWDGTSETEERINDQTKATIRCIPLEGDKEEGKCVLTGAPSKQRVIFAKAY